LSRVSFPKPPPASLNAHAWTPQSLIQCVKSAVCEHNRYTHTHTHTHIHTTHTTPHTHTHTHTHRFFILRTLPVVAACFGQCVGLLSNIFFIPTTQHPSPPVGQGLLIIPPSRPPFATPHSVGFLWTSDQPDAETSTW